MHWADVFTSKLEGYQVISTGISPSGPIHVGNMREILTGDIIYRSCIDRNLEARFIYLCDDMDPLRKRYPFLPEGFQEHVGKPLYRIPSPSGEGSYSEHYLIPFLRTLDRIEVRSETIFTHQLYREGFFADVIDLAMKRRHDIKKILESMSGRKIEGDWYPYNPVCENCNKITDATIKSYVFPYVYYECKCGHSGRSDVRKDDGKMPWRVEWPAKWLKLKVTVESFGKDHAAAGSSYDTGKEIIEKVMGGKAPSGIVYEHIFLKGKGAMHSSTGITIAASDMVQFAPPEIIRFLIAKNNPGRHIDFDPGIGLLNLVEEFDRYRMAYHGEGEVPDEDFKRVYEFSRISTSEMEVSVGFRHLVTLVQIYSDTESLQAAIERSGYRVDVNKEPIKSRIEEAKLWLALYAPEDVKFTLLPGDLEVKVSESEFRFIADLSEALSGVEWKPDSIHNTIYEEIGKSGIEQRAAFQLLYRILIGKTRGPRLGYFLSNLSRQFVIKRLSSCSVSS